MDSNKKQNFNPYAKAEYERIEAKLIIGNHIIPIGDDTLSNFLRYMPETEEYKTLYQDLARSSSAKVREEVYGKLLLDEEQIKTAIKNNDPALEIHRNYKKRTSIIRLITEADIDMYIQNNDFSKLKRIAESIEELENIDLVKLAKRIFELSDSEPAYALADNREAPMEIVKMFLEHPDPDVVKNAKLSLKEVYEDEINSVKR